MTAQSSQGLAAIPTDLRHACLTECIDCLAVLFPDSGVRMGVGRAMAAVWALDDGLPGHLMEVARPAWHEGPDGVR